jgi:hypothetical protein
VRTGAAARHAANAPPNAPRGRPAHAGRRLGLPTLVMVPVSGAGETDRASHERGVDGRAGCPCFRGRTRPRGRSMGKKNWGIHAAA